MAIDSSKYLANKIDAIQGGTDTLSSIKAAQETILDAARSSLSTAYTSVIGSEVICYAKVPTIIPEYIGCFRIDFTNMTSVDTIIVRKYLIIESGGSYLLASTDAAYTYTGVQTVKVVEMFESTYNTYGCKFVILHSVASGSDVRVFKTETIDASSGV